jgi:type IV fimbrial biogenesis protein FimT
VQLLQSGVGKEGNVAGVTLWELCVTIMLVGIVVGIGAPSLHRFVLDARLVADVNAFVGAVQLARSEAAKRGRSVIVCKTLDHVSCGGDDIDFDAGWMVFVNTDDMSPPTRAANEPLIFAHSPASVGTIVSNRPFYEFRAYRRRSTNGTVTFCDARGPPAARAVIISYTGRPRVAALGPGNRPLICA